MNNNSFIDVAKKEIEKALIRELFHKGIIDFPKCSSIIKKLDDDIVKLEKNTKKSEKLTNIVVKIPI